MRACFLGQNICALGFGVALVQIPPLNEPAQPPAGDKPMPAPSMSLPGMPVSGPWPLETPMIQELKRLSAPLS